MVYCMHVALFWKSTVVLEESVVEICATSPWYEWNIWLNENIIVGLYWKHVFKWELSKWRLGGSDQGEEYTCQILLLKKCNLRNVHLQILRQSNTIWTYGILYARGTLLKEYGRPWRICCWNCSTPPWYEWDIWLNENIIVGLYWKRFFKWELSKWRLGGSDQGEEYTCQILLLKKM